MLVRLLQTAPPRRRFAHSNDARHAFRGSLGVGHLPPFYEATNVCAAEGKVLCGVDKPCSRSGCSYDFHYQWTGEECQAGDAGLPAAC